MIALLCLVILTILQVTSSRQIYNNYRSNCALGNINASIMYRRMMDFFNLGPKRGLNYHPNFGYEPYWPGGDWVFDRYDTTTEKRNGTMCGEECPEIYEHFGYVCGRNIKYKHKTFNNYCELVNEDCSGREKWLIAYRGKCQDELKTYPTKYNQMATRAMKYISDFDENNPSTILLNKEDFMMDRKRP